MIENCGYQKEVDWVESQLRVPQQIDSRIARLTELVMQRYHLHLAPAKNTRDFLRRYADKFFEILDHTYENIYGTVPFTPAMKKALISNFKLIINLKYVAVLLNEKDEVVCFGLCLPSLAEVFQKSHGRITIPTLFRVLKTVRHPKVVDLALVGVLPEYTGATAVIINEIMKILTERGVEYCETNLNLEHNTAVLNLWKNFDQYQNKRRRCFVKNL